MPVRPPRADARRLATLAVAPLLLAACHFGRSPKPMVTARVANTLVPEMSVTVSLIPESGSRRTIGVVGPGRTEELRFPAGSSTDPHRLLAESVSGSALVSRPFTLSNASRVEWDVGRNTLNVSDRR